jgi:hypothetical protein
MGLQVRDPEVRAQVDDPLSSAHQGPCELGRGAVGEREEEERDVARRQGGRVGGHEPYPAVDAADRGDHLGERIPGMHARGHGRQLNLGVSKEQLHERLARVTRRAYDADLHGRGTIRSVAFKIQ